MNVLDRQSCPSIKTPGFENLQTQGSDKNLLKSNPKWFWCDNYAQINLRSAFGCCFRNPNLVNFETKNAL